MKTFLVLLLVSAAYAGVLHQPAFLEDLRSLSGNRIISGNPAINGQFPWQAYIVITTSSGGRGSCGGSLIRNNWILTAAHCVQGISAQVYLGHVAFASSPEIITTAYLVPHPDYNPANLNNDVALIRLPSAVTLTANIAVVPLATNTTETYAGSSATVSGFGLTANTGSISPTLNFVGVNVITNSVCADTFGTSVIIASTLCVVGGTTAAQGACNGDSGGPLVLPVSGVATQIGVVSFGSTAGCTSNAPNGFARTSHFASWINSIAV